MSLNERARQAFTPREIRDAYSTVFRGPKGSLVLAHLADACGATRSTYDPTQHAMNVAEGRRQVWLVIQDALNLTEDDLRGLQSEVANRGSEMNE